MKQKKHLITALLVILLFLPFITIQIYNSRYTALENNICATDKAFADACDYPERLERYKTLSTNFYRYLGDQFGREMGTSPPFTFTIHSIANPINGSNPQAERSGTGDLAYKEYEAEQKLGKFNLSLLIAFTVSVVIASMAALLLLQRGWKDQGEHQATQ